VGWVPWGLLRLAARASHPRLPACAQHAWPAGRQVWGALHAGGAAWRRVGMLRGAPARHARAAVRDLVVGAAWHGTQGGRGARHAPHHTPRQRCAPQERAGRVAAGPRGRLQSRQRSATPHGAHGLRFPSTSEKQAAPRPAASGAACSARSRGAAPAAPPACPQAAAACAPGPARARVRSTAVRVLGGTAHHGAALHGPALHDA